MRARVGAIRFILALVKRSIPPELLARLAEHAARMDRLAEASVATVIADLRERNGRGEVIHVLHSEARVVRSNGRTTTRVLLATRDGQDDLAAAQRRADEQDRTPKKESPFAVSQHQGYEYVCPQEDRILIVPNGKLSHPDLMVGEARIDPAAGECVRLTGRPWKPGPFVLRAEFSFAYETETPEGRMLSAMTLDYAGGLLFLRRQGDLRMSFSFAKPGER